MGHKKKGPKPKPQEEVTESPVPSPPPTPEDDEDIESVSSGGYVMSTSARRRKNKLRNEQKAKAAAGFVEAPNESKLPPVPKGPTEHFEEVAGALEKEADALKTGKPGRSAYEEFLKKLAHTVEAEKASLKPKPSFRGTVDQLRQQIYDMASAYDGKEESDSIEVKEAKAMETELQTQLERLVEHEAFRAFQHRVAGIKLAVEQQQQQKNHHNAQQKESAAKAGRPPKAQQDGGAARLAHKLQQIIGREAPVRPEELHHKEVGKDSISGDLLDLLFTSSGPGPLAHKWEKEYKVCLQPIVGDKRAFTGVKATGIEETAVEAAVERLGSFNPTCSRSVSLIPDNGNTNPNVLNSVRRRVFQLAHQLEGRHGVVMVKNQRGDSITIYGPDSEDVAKAVQEAHSAVNERPRPRAGSGGGGDHREGGGARRGEFRDTSLKFEVGVAKCVVGDRGENVKRLECLSKCQIQIKGPAPDPKAHKNTGVASVTVRGATAGDVATGVKMVKDYASSVAKRVVSFPDKEALDKLFGAGQGGHTPLASRFATIRRQCGCTILRDSDTTLQVLLPLDKDPSLEKELNGAVTEIEKLVEEASVGTTSIPVAPDHLHLWEDTGNLRNIQRKSGLIRVTLRKGGEGEEPQLDLTGNAQAVTKARGLIDKLIETSGTAEIFNTLKECSEDESLVEAVISMLLVNRAAKLHQISKDSGALLHVDETRKAAPGESRNVKVVGGPTEVALAVKLLRRAVAEHKALLALMETVEVKVPQEKVAAVLGPSGRTLHRIQAATLCTDVQLTKRAPEGTTGGPPAICLIRGTEEAVKKAERLVREIVKAGTTSNLEMNGSGGAEAAAPATEPAAVMGARDAQPRLRNKGRGAWGASRAAGGKGGAAVAASSSKADKGGSAAASKKFVFDENDFPALVNLKEKEQKPAEKQVATAK
ncbi:hypothetical protein FOL47_000920 [Perkinsus chesapeaki]|uniref:K Homology domain-containing protein n=1 Tax=Perkinsus chesapeaki TaxID=330153 RepID=A0A7J6N0W8_PERCH|nr:hypothetical protein FOL47_000920 [Perkinsus chesapeaki]